jgi:nucleotide-binding universal stress UspA family protein
MKTLDACARIQLKNILFATDFSPAADAAIPYASELAKRYGAKLFALHVRPTTISPLIPPELWSRSEEAAEIEKEQQTRNLLDSFSLVRPEVLIHEGGIWENLEAAISANEIGLIVIGTRGRSGVGKLFLGSVAEEVFRKASCPVLTVGPRSFIWPRERGEFTRILFATDLTGEAVAAPYAISLAQEYQTYLTLLHVVGSPEGDEPSRCLELLRSLVPPEAELWCVPDCVVEPGWPAAKILEVAMRRKVDLIVMGAREPRAFPSLATHLPMSTAHEVVCHAACPVLTVRR